MEERISKFKKAEEGMIRKNDLTWNGNYRDKRYCNYTLEEIQKIVEEGTPDEQAALSYAFFLKDGLYRRLILHYASLLEYSGLLIPISGKGNKLSNSGVSKRYDMALEYLNKLNIKETLTRITTKVLVRGRYAGFINTLNKNEFVLIDLPFEYCRSRYVNFKGIDVLEFNVA